MFRYVAGIDLHIYGKTDAQRIFVQFTRIERDADGHALNDLDPVAAGILRRQQGKGIAAARRQSDDMAMKDNVTALCIGSDGCGLSNAQPLEPGFETIGRSEERRVGKE